MNRRKTLFPSLILLLLCFCRPFVGLGQQRFTPKGVTYTVGQYKGKATYSYQLVGIDTIKEGPFSLERSNVAALLKENDSAFAFNGQFKANHPVGNWRFQFGSFKTDSTAQINGFQYQLNVNGQLKEASGAVSEDMPTGDWVFSRLNIQDSKVQDTLFSSKITFLEGMPQQRFTMQAPQGVLVGRFLRNGKAHDIWSLYSPEAILLENWYFKDGLLTKIERRLNGQMKAVAVFSADLQGDTQLALGKGFLNLLAVYADLPLNNDGGISGLLGLYGQQSSHIKGLMQALGAKNFAFDIQFRVPHYPKPEADVARLDSALTNVQAAVKTSKNLLGNTSVNLLKRSNPRVAYLYQVLQALDANYWQPLQAMAGLKTQGLLQHITTDKITAHLFPNGMPSTALTIKDAGTFPATFTGPNAADYSFEQGNLANFIQMATYAENALHQVAAELELLLAQQMQEQEFVRLEEQMIAKANRINAYADSLMVAHPAVAEKSLQHIKTTAESLLETYAAMPLGKEKLSQAKQLVVCLDQYHGLAQQVAALPAQQIALEKLYKDAIWNPFTATIMDETVKKRILGTYKNVLVPYLLTQTTAALSCQNAAELLHLFDTLHQQMHHFREADTARLERKLRKEEDPKGVLQLFNLKPLQP